MEVDEWPRIGIGDGGSFGELVNSERGEGFVVGINSRKDLNRLEPGGGNNVDLGKNCANGQTYGDQKLNAINVLQAYDPFAVKHSCDQSVGWSRGSMEHRIAYGNNELHEDDRYVDLSNDEARYNKSNAGYDLDKDLGGYDNADSCADAVYVYNAGNYDTDDECDAANDGADKYGVDANIAYNYNDEVFWWSGYPQGDNDGDALVHRTKTEKTGSTTMMLIGVWYSLAAGVILTWILTSFPG